MPTKLMLQKHSACHGNCGNLTANMGKYRLLSLVTFCGVNIDWPLKHRQVPVPSACRRVAFPGPMRWSQCLGGLWNYYRI